MSSTGAKGSQQTNKKTKDGFEQRELNTSQRHLGLAHQTVRCATSVRCTRELEAELATFGKMGGHSAIIHRTIR
jgi:hypothetical protein